MGVCKGLRFSIQRRQRPLADRPRGGSFLRYPRYATWSFPVISGYFRRLTGAVDREAILLENRQRIIGSEEI